MNEYSKHLIEIGKNVREWLEKENFDEDFGKAFPLGKAQDSMALYQSQKAKIRDIRFFLAESMTIKHVQVIHKGLNPHTKELIGAFLSRGNEFKLPRSPIDELIPSVTGQKEHRKILWEWRAQNIVQIPGNRSILVSYINRICSILIKGTECPITFDKPTGQIFFKGDLLGALSVNELPFKFFEILYDRFGNYVTHEFITGELFGKNENGKALLPVSGYAQYCSKIKAQIPKEIRIFIDWSKGNYVLTSIPKDS